MAEEPNATAGARVLVVDDEANLRRLLCDLLDEEGYRVTAAASGPEALAQVESCRFDAVVIDFRLGKECGLDLLRAIRQRSPATSCIMMTGEGDREFQELAARSGAWGTILKPFRGAELKGLVASGVRAGGVAA